MNEWDTRLVQPLAIRTIVLLLLKAPMTRPVEIPVWRHYVTGRAFLFGVQTFAKSLAASQRTVDGQTILHVVEYIHHWARDIKAAGLPSIETP